MLGNQVHGLNCVDVLFVQAALNHFEAVQQSRRVRVSSRPEAVLHGASLLDQDVVTSHLILYCKVIGRSYLILLMADFDDLLCFFCLFIDLVDRVARERLVERLEEVVNFFTIQLVL